ncbi:hypothetical protein BJ165DRAFT_577726 [Panaeolus papilionaceus]|nr:hypothetical protein BJ165DRAFT_577726 [Panaeolus papilionaceus]
MTLFNAFTNTDILALLYPSKSCYLPVLPPTSAHPYIISQPQAQHFPCRSRNRSHRDAIPSPSIPSPISQKGRKRSVSQQEFERENEWNGDECDHPHVYHAMTPSFPIGIVTLAPREVHINPTPHSSPSRHLIPPLSLGSGCLPPPHPPIRIS